MRNIYIIQNEGEAYNFSAICKSKDIVITFDDVTQFDTESYFKNKDVKVFNPKFSFKKNKSNFIYKIFNSFLLRRESLLFFKGNLNHKHKYNVFISNDGPYVKAIISSLKTLDISIVVELWIDTMIGDRGKYYKELAISKINLLASKFNIDYILPSILGTSYFINKILVPIQPFRDVLINRGVNKNKIEVADTPRISSLKNRELPRVINNRYLFVASAWEWHGRNECEIWQKNAINDLIRLFESVSLGGCFYVRFHPRQTKLQTKFLDKQYISKVDNYIDDIALSTHVISYRSTALFDATILNKKTYIYDKNAPFAPGNKFLESITKLNSINDLL